MKPKCEMKSVSPHSHCRLHVGCSGPGYYECVLVPSIVCHTTLVLTLTDPTLNIAGLLKYTLLCEHYYIDRRKSSHYDDITVMQVQVFFSYYLPFNVQRDKAYEPDCEKIGN